MNTKEELERKEYEELVRIQTEKLKKEFKIIDKDGNDKIDEEELMNFLEGRSKKLEKDSFKKLIQTLDLDNDGLITM
jgi:Ca2+-binding EF-hand superfamily protein